MNTLVFDVYKNTVKKADGFNPVNAEKGYTNLLFKFKKGDDWEKCCAVTLSFFESSDDITHSQVDIKEDSLTATFRLPNAYKSLFLGITGVYIDDEGESVTVATNIIKINLIKGVIVTDSVNMDVYEKLMSYFATVRKSDLPMVDIRNFGAVADNPSVDNAEAIKKAIEFASRKRGRVYIPPATFYVNSTIPIRNKENLTIINDGVIYAKSKELRNNKFTTLFSCEQCKNLNFAVGTIKSDRDKLSKAPVNYTRKNLNGSNIIGVHINNCEDVVIDDYTADGLEYAVVINADEDGVVSKNIVLKKFKAFNTSQPIYGAYFENFSIHDIYCESCPDCGLGDHFIYISAYSKNLLVNSARLVYTDNNYGVAINLRYAGSSAGVDNGVLSDEYDASKDLNKADIFDVTVENCEQFLSAKAKTKVYVKNCTINSSVESSRKCLFLEEYAELYVKNSSFIFSADNPLLSIGNNASHNVTFNNCTIKVGFLFDIGSNSATDKDVFSKNIAFLNCDIVCTSNTMSPIWLNCASEINVSFVNSKLSTNRFYTFYVGNDNIRYSIIGTEFNVDESANGLRLIYTPYDTDNTTGYSPNDNVQVINCVCRNIKRICSSQNIVDYNNLIFDKEGNVISNSGTVGKDGEDGYSPTATVTQTDTGAVITITDESGTTTARVMNGADGKDGANGANGADGYTPVKGTDYFTEADKAEMLEEITTELNSDGISDYMLEHLEAKINDIKTLQDKGGKDCFSFVVLADMHWGSNIGKKSPQLAKYIMDKCGIKKCLVLGDTQSRGAWSTKEKAEAEFDETAEAFEVINGKLRTQGNHDGSWGTLDGKSYAYNFTPNEIFNRIYRNVYAENANAKTDSSGTAYYVDDDTDKVRYIMLNTHCNAYTENDDGSVMYNNMKVFRFTQSQYDFLCNDALATVPEGYSVIVGAHAPISNMYADLFGGTDGEAKTMRGLLTAYRNKTTYSREWAGTAGGGAAYTNLADSSSSDWLTGYRLNSSGVTTSYAECITTNYIPVKDYDVVRVKGINLLEATGGYVCGYDTNKTIVGNSMKFDTYPDLLTKISDDEYEFNTIGLAAYNETGELAYVRFSGSLTGEAEEVVIAVNEEIVESEHGYDYINVNADFTQSKGELVGYFSGHTHADYVYSKNDWGVNIITHRCDAKEENDSTVSAERVEGTTTEQSFDVVTVNTATKTIYLTKIGAGSDRSVSY